jgi:hypothetical protein
METYKVKRVLLAGTWFVPQHALIYIDRDAIGWFTADGGRIAAKRRAVDALETPASEDANSDGGNPSDLLMAPMPKMPT